VNIRAIYTPEVISSTEDEMLSDAAQRMAASEVSSLAVTREGEVIGILTERDLVQSMADEVSPKRTHVSAYMTRSPYVLDIDSDSNAAAQRMIDLGVRHLPVVENGNVVGIVSARDLLVLETWPGELSSTRRGS